MMIDQRMTELENICRRIRGHIVSQIAAAGVGHIGGSLSIVETLVALYFNVMNIDPKNPQMEGRDRFILSKGHAGPALYAVLAERGYFDISMLETLNKPGTHLPSHCDMILTPGVDMTAGSLGQGFSCAVGQALGSRIRRDRARVYAMVGDGESQEGQIWEAAMFAAHKKLDNLIAFTDFNGMQISGMVEDVNNIEPLADKWRAFGFHVIEVRDGNDIRLVLRAIEQAHGNTGKPTMIILHTVKGKGISFAEQAGYNCHSMTITKEQRDEALRELGLTAGGQRHV
jgi:transketolase